LIPVPFFHKPLFDWILPSCFLAIESSTLTKH
jgi:hypothetical protein